MTDQAEAESLEQPKVFQATVLLDLDVAIRELQMNLVLQFLCPFSFAVERS